MAKRMSVYCKAYPLALLRKFPGWTESMIVDRPEGGGSPPLDSATTVFIHPDYRVTLGVMVDAGEPSAADPAWERYCSDELKFAVPEELKGDDGEADRG